ncbi:MAG: hypothetical protein COV45_00920 [Deltaproteobacteria bacterium CG11_big_fil_rev_8_21_14_0_20_47_16]|nr:MAG: hypothetical protein COV45_00920 [Deltaproteobacteria bacterium CG11_big_fil_rev_8_21_14_0_20_47_16]
MSNPQFTIRTFYRFVRLENIADLRQAILTHATENKLCGTILLANEGINSTISGSAENMNRFWQQLTSYPEFTGMPYKESFSSEAPFKRMKVRLKREIVSLYQPQVDPTQVVGDYVDAQKWNELIQDPECLVIDVRNHYEVEMGTFENAQDPKTNSFKEFAQFATTQCDPQKHKKVAMFCTGGIRCEKASSYMKQLGFENVYHLNGGILKYLEDVSASESLWHGDCYVFDEREAVGHGLVPRQKK